MNLRAALALAFASLLLLPQPSAPALAVATSGCQFVLGFKTLHDLIPDKVGECRTNEYHNAQNGDGLQETTGGLLVWRKADNWTAFTDGYRTWVNGPAGLQQRLNTQRFPWEKDDRATAPEAGMPNPASVNCVEKGGKLEIVKGQAGEIGMCLFPDGGACEEWALFRGECRPGDKQSQSPNPATRFCADNGGSVEVVDKGTAAEWNKCVFADRSWCDEWAYFRGACGPGANRQ